MELKYMKDIEKSLGIKVLIVPLWNWNYDSEESQNKGARFNCTFMELKYDSMKPGAAFYIVLIVPLWNWNWRTSDGRHANACFNCTFMELKWKDWRRHGVAGHRFNCTFMELKWSDGVAAFSVPSVLIVPLWNWNN